MNDDEALGFEPIDDALRRGLGGSEPAFGDPDVVLATLTPRFRRARRRHRVVVASSTALALVAIIAVGSVVATTDGGRGRNVQTPPANTGQPDSPVTTTTLTPPTPTSGPTPTLPQTTGAGGAAPAPAPTADAGTSPTVAAPVTKTYASAGGSVTVRVANGALSIVSTAPASGYTEERHDTGPVRVEVRFKNGQSGTEWRIKVELSNGEPQEEITKH